MKVKYCGNQECGETCMPRWASIVCVAVGASAVGVISYSKLDDIIAELNLGSFAQIEGLVFFLIILFVAIAIFFSLFERFEHYITAVAFGGSVPGLLFAIAQLGAMK